MSCSFQLTLTHQSLPPSKLYFSVQLWYPMVQYLQALHNAQFLLHCLLHCLTQSHSQLTFLAIECFSEVLVVQHYHHHHLKYACLHHFQYLDADSQKRGCH
ncbi:hypothetical protein QL285_085729 [Trifolium repens]|nr:hypothetical protein QL285_085729 [Trifolium repens]